MTCTNINLEMLEKNVESYVNEFKRHALLGSMKEALKTYELYGKNMDMEDIKWRGWQRNLT